MIRWALGLFVLLISALPASAGWGGWWQSLPPCGNSDVLYRISERAAWAEHNTWHRGWVIASISHVGETALNPGPSHIHRRYCRGTAWLSNGQRLELVYVIEAGQGFASIGWNVEFCLPTYDPWRIYDAWCRSIRPDPY
jgi:hypothetical protein